MAKVFIAGKDKDDAEGILKHFFGESRRENNDGLRKRTKLEEFI